MVLIWLFEINAINIATLTLRDYAFSCLSREVNKQQIKVMVNEVYIDQQVSFM